MLSNRIIHLAPPPRRVPLTVVCRAMLGLTGGMGAAFFTMGMLFVWFSLGDLTSSFWTCLVVPIFPIVGVALFGVATAQGLRQVTLLRHGELASAQTLGKQRTNTSVNNKPVLKYTYQFQARDWQTYSGACKALSSEEIGDDVEEAVLYLPSNPQVSTLVDALPLRCTLDVDGAGEWVSYESVWPVIWCGLAWMGVAAHVVYGLGLLLGVV